jgi:hypothetical protein
MLLVHSVSAVAQAQPKWASLALLGVSNSWLLVEYIYNYTAVFTTAHGMSSDHADSPLKASARDICQHLSGPLTGGTASV